MRDDLAPEVRRALEEVGWYPGRRAPQATVWANALREEGYVVDETVEAVLAEFGGLRYDQRGPGVDFAREPFALDPMLGSGEKDRFAWRGSGLGFFPLGEGAGGHAFVVVSREGALYLVMDSVHWVGGTVWEGLYALIRGCRMPPSPSP